MQCTGDQADGAAAGTPHQFQNPLFGRTPPSADSDGQACLVSAYTPATAQAASHHHNHTAASPPKRGNLFAASPAGTTDQAAGPVPQQGSTGMFSNPLSVPPDQHAAKQSEELAGLEALEASLGRQPEAAPLSTAAAPSRQQAFAQSQDILAALPGCSTPAAAPDINEATAEGLEQPGIPHVAGVDDLTALAAGLASGQVSPLDTPMSVQISPRGSPAEPPAPTPLRMGGNLSAMHMRALLNSQRKAQRPVAPEAAAADANAVAARCASVWATAGAAPVGRRQPGCSGCLLLNRAQSFRACTPRALKLWASLTSSAAGRAPVTMLLHKPHPSGPSPLVWAGRRHRYLGSSALLSAYPWQALQAAPCVSARPKGGAPVQQHPARALEPVSASGPPLMLLSSRGELVQSWGGPRHKQ